MKIPDQMKVIMSVNSKNVEIKTNKSNMNIK